MIWTRRLAVALGLALTAAPTLVVRVHAASAVATFSAIASADGVRTSSADPSVVPLGAEVGVSGPTAQAAIDSVGNSRGFASLPYPGDAVVSAPGLARGQGASGVPDYPFYAASSSQGPTTTNVSTPAGYRLHAASDDTSSAATATAGGGGVSASMGSSVSIASVKVTSDALTAHAEATTELFEVVGVLTIGRVHAVADAVGRAGHAPRLSSQVQVGAITVAGQAVTLPIPSASPAAAILAGAGVTLRTTKPQQTSTGITSGGVDITVVQGDLKSTYSLGRVTADAAGAPDGATTVTSPPVADGTSLPSTAAIPSRPFETNAAPSPLPQAAATATPPPAPFASRATPSASPGPRLASPVAKAAAFGVPSSLFSTASLYLILVLAAIACFGGMQLIRYLGVRFTWN